MCAVCIYYKNRSSAKQVYQHANPIASYKIRIEHAPKKSQWFINETTHAYKTRSEKAFIIAVCFMGYCFFIQAAMVVDFFLPQQNEERNKNNKNSIWETMNGRWMGNGSTTRNASVFPCLLYSLQVFLFCFLGWTICRRWMTFAHWYQVFIFLACPFHHCRTSSSPIFVVCIRRIL